MALTSSSTYANAIAQYNDNLSWEGDSAKALLTLEAIRWLLVNRPQSTSRSGRSVNYATLSEEKIKLETFVNNQGSSVTRAPFTRGRMLT